MSLSVGGCYHPNHMLACKTTPSKDVRPTTTRLAYPTYVARMHVSISPSINGSAEAERTKCLFTFVRRRNSNNTILLLHPLLLSYLFISPSRSLRKDLKVSNVLIVLTFHVTGSSALDFSIGETLLTYIHTLSKTEGRSV